MKLGSSLSSRHYGCRTSEQPIRPESALSSLDKRESSVPDAADGVRARACDGNPPVNHFKSASRCNAVTKETGRGAFGADLPLRTSWCGFTNRGVRACRQAAIWLLAEDRILTGAFYQPVAAAFVAAQADFDATWSGCRHDVRHTRPRSTVSTLRAKWAFL